MVDEDENQYIDFIGSWGPMILGHSNPIILDAIKAQLELGTSYGALTTLENTLARIIKGQVPSMEKHGMVNSGTEATMSCVRAWLEALQVKIKLLNLLVATMDMLIHCLLKQALGSLLLACQILQGYPKN